MSFELENHCLLSAFQPTRCYIVAVVCYWCRSSSVSIVSDYGLDVRTIGFRSPAGAKDFPSSLCVQTSSEAHPASCTMRTGGPFPGAKHGRGVTLTTHPHLVLRSKMSRGYTSSPSAIMMCSGTALLLLFAIYSSKFIFVVERKVSAPCLQALIFLESIKSVAFNSQSMRLEVLKHRIWRWESSG
jgi:hypothetical protein